MRWVAVVGWMVVIFYFSHQSGDDSAALSSGVVQTITSVTPQTSPEDIHTLLRKAAHVGEYTVLGILLGWALQVRSWAQVGLGLVMGVGYAITDEIHQLFIPGRSGEVGDVFIDGFGVACGVGLMFFSYTRGYIGCYMRHNGYLHRSRGVIREKQ